MNEQKLIFALTSINTWWKGEPISQQIKKSNNKRKVFFNVSQRCLENKKILSISGPRQVGKTTLIGQLIEHQIKEKKQDPKRIIYVPVDNELLNLNADNVLIDSLKIFFEHIIGESPEKLTKKIYIYLDEIQSLKNWAKQIKSYYDVYDKIKFIISGSSHTKLYADASESLVGRIEFRLLLPFKFREFLEYHVGDKISKDLEFSHVTLRKGLELSIQKKDPSYLYKAVQRLQIKISSELPQIKKILNSYLIKGGYPGLLEYGERYDMALERIKTDLELTIYKDIHKIFNTRNSSDLMSLLTLLSSSCGQKINYSRLSSILRIDRRVVANYISHLKLVCLINESSFYKGSKYREMEKMNKVYLVDVGHRNALLGKMNETILTEAEIGLVIQNVVFNHSTRLKFLLTKYTNYEINYWEDKNYEIDIIFDLPLLVLPMEVKSKEIGKALKHIKKFIGEHKKSKWGVIVNKEDLRLEENILFIPLWAFLLMC